MANKFQEYRFELIVLVLAALLRVGAIAVYGNAEQPQLYEYGGIARHILAGEGYAHVFPILHPEYGIARRVYDNAVPTAFTLPGYVLVMTAVLGTFGDGSTAYVVLYGLNLFTSLLALLLLYAFTATLLSKSTARWALLLAAVFPPIVASTATFGGTPWTHMVMLSALLLVWRSGMASARETMSRTALTWLTIAAGAMTGIWTLFRGEALGAAVLIAVWMWARQRTWRRAALYLAACLVVVLPWSVRNTLTFDRFVPLTTNFWLNAWRGNHEGVMGGSFKPEGGSNWLTPEIQAEIEAIPPTPQYEIQLMDLYRTRTMEFVRAHPGEAILLYIRKVGMFLTIDWSDPRARHPLFLYPQLLMMAFTLAGAFLLWRRRRVPWPLVYTVLVTMFSVAALHVESRYQLMMGILYIVFAAPALQALFRHFYPDNESTAHG